jgi:4'-phosphopantetheinyl transferase
MSASMLLPKAHAASAASRHDIDIWLTYYNEMIDDRQLPRLRSLLSDEEAARESHFYFADDRKRYLVTRAMVRMLLSRYAPIAPERWVFSKNSYGRPVIADAIAAAETEARDLFFNLSHTRGLIVLAVTRGRELGVDVENIAARTVSLDIAKHFFSADEVAELARVAPDRQQDRFFEYWTFKESYIKARGMGLSLPLNGFSFEFPQREAVQAIRRLPHGALRRTHRRQTAVGQPAHLRPAGRDMGRDDASAEAFARRLRASTSCESPRERFAHQHSSPSSASSARDAIMPSCG